MDKQRLYSLLSKFKDNACTEQELAELEFWYESLDSDNQLIGEEEAEPFIGKMLLQFREKLATERRTVPFYKRYFFRVAAAAAIILLVGTGVYFLAIHRNSKTELAKIDEALLQDIAAPNETKATITLEDGRTVLVSSISNGTLAVQGNVNVVKMADGKIVYNPESGMKGQELRYNVISNPRGSKVQPLTLSDGTKVWLNSESSLRYPTAFTGKERIVEITGEAYFEVAHNAAQPFSVRDVSRDVKIGVLGTHFNVNTYTDESAMKITLLEGSVKVTKGNTLGLLKPGQQAQVESSIKIVDGTDLNAVMAWKNGYFIFNNTDVKVLMRQMARWYDIDVAYESSVPMLRFGGEVPRNTNLSEVMEILKTSGVKFMIDGRRVTIKP